MPISVKAPPRLHVPLRPIKREGVCSGSIARYNLLRIEGFKNTLDVISVLLAAPTRHYYSHPIPLSPVNDTAGSYRHKRPASRARASASSISSLVIRSPLAICRSHHDNAAASSRAMARRLSLAVA